MFGRFFRRRHVCSEEVLRHLFDRYWWTLYRQARLLLPPHQDPEDAAADVWLQVVREASSYDPERPPLPWLARICTRVCLDRRRARRHHWVARPGQVPLEHALAGQASTADAQAHAADLRRALHRAVDRLARRRRHVVVMRFFFGLSIGEIAALKGMTVPAATQALIRGLRQLRESPEAPALRALLGATEGHDG